MAGILDSRSRIVDFILTGEGKKDLAAGKLNISFATFTDSGTYYVSSSSGVRTPMPSSFTFEAYASAGDIITLERDFNGVLIPPAVTEGATTTFISSGSSDSRFQTFDKTVLRTGEILDAMSLIKSDLTFENFDSSIVQNRDNLSVSVADYVYGSETVNLSEVAYVFTDNRFSNFNSFKYMPPVVENSSGDSQVFSFYGIPQLFSFTAFNPQIISDIPSFDFSPQDSSSLMSVAAQIFEYNESAETSSEWNKLDMIYYGPSTLGDGTNAHVFFAGKRIFRDQAFSFVNLFTVLVRY
jgi:hypothetical protein